MARSFVIEAVDTAAYVCRVGSTATTASAAAFCAILLTAATGRAQAPPPDPTQGERSDGRIESTDKRQWALAVPRVLLLPLRGLFDALAYPTQPIVAFMEKYNVPLWLRSATTTADGLRGVRPELSWNLGFGTAPGL